eukprot:219049-Rhodomonas_salina.1
MPNTAVPIGGNKTQPSFVCSPLHNAAIQKNVGIYGYRNFCRCLLYNCMHRNSYCCFLFSQSANLGRCPRILDLAATCRPINNDNDIVHNASKFDSEN